MTPSPGTTRFEELASFLEEVMTDPKASRRVRLSAAQRLDGLLQRQERRETSQARHADREAVAARKREEQASGAKDTPAPEVGADDQLRQFDEWLANHRKV
jgi:hypothetical protein